VQPYVTEIDLRHSLIPEELIDEMIKTMPTHRGESAPEDATLPKYDYVNFMQRYLGPSGVGANGHGR
jgi:Ca2+ insensitive EF hand